MRTRMAADVMGAIDVTCRGDCRPGSLHLGSSGRQLPSDVHPVAIELAAAGGVETLTSSSHASMRNSSPEDRNPRVRRLAGRHTGSEMAKVVKQRPNLAVSVGIHSPPPGSTAVLGDALLRSGVSRSRLNVQLPMTVRPLLAGVQAEVRGEECPESRRPRQLELS